MLIELVGGPMDGYQAEIDSFDEEEIIIDDRPGQYVCIYKKTSRVSKSCFPGEPAEFCYDFVGWLDSAEQELD